MQEIRNKRLLAVVRKLPQFTQLPEKSELTLVCVMSLFATLWTFPPHSSLMWVWTEVRAKWSYVPAFTFCPSASAHSSSLIFYFILLFVRISSSCFCAFVKLLWLHFCEMKLRRKLYCLSEPFVIISYFVHLLTYNFISHVFISLT